MLLVLSKIPSIIERERERERGEYHTRMIEIVFIHTFMIFNILYCNNQIIAIETLVRHAWHFEPHCCKIYIPTPYLILLSEHTELLLIINILIICNNNKYYMSLRIGICIFFSNVSDSFLICFFHYILFT